MSCIRSSQCPETSTRGFWTVHPISVFFVTAVAYTLPIYFYINQVLPIAFCLFIFSTRLPYLTEPTRFCSVRLAHSSVPKSAPSTMPRLLSILSIAIPAALAIVQYQVPHSLAALVEDTDCILPDDFNVQKFVAESADGGKTLGSFDFIFADDSTNATTPCHFNSSSKSVVDDGRTPRFACDNSNVQFIWQNLTLTLIEAVCPGDDG